MTIVAGDVLRTSMNFTMASGQLYQNIYHHQRTGVGILSDAAHVTAIELWSEAAYAEMNAVVAAGVVEGLCSVDLVEFLAGQWTVVENIGVFTPTIAFADGATSMPSQLSPYVILKTDRPQSVGRKFLFPLTEAQYDAGQLVVGAVNAIVAYADDIINNIVIQVLDDLVPGITRVGLDVFLPVHTAIVTSIVGTQRRRRIGVGA